MMTVQTILPQPFEWVHIPSGDVFIQYGEWDKLEFRVREVKKLSVSAFDIAKYPVTNAQYDVFINHPDGYKNPKWWDFSDEAKKWFYECDSQIEASYFVGDDCPRDSVSWYDSMAFCLWLSAMTDEKIMLPTEWQWQRAMIGDGHQKYAWGDAIDATFANYNQHIRKTTPVTHYPAGKSVFGVMDMIGNLWEWCLNSYETQHTDLSATDERALRGGSWINPPELVNALVYDGAPPHVQDYCYGFRCVLLR